MEKENVSFDGIVERVKNMLEDIQTYGIYVYGEGKNGPPYTFGENFVQIGEMYFFSVGNEFTELLDETGIR